MFFFFKQKTAYEVRISDWSSDVCSSDLVPDAGHGTAGDHHRRHLPLDYPLLHSHGDLADHHHGVPRDRPVAAEPVYGQMKEVRRRDRKSGGYGKSVPVRVDHGGRRIIIKNIKE